MFALTRLVSPSADLGLGRSVFYRYGDTIVNKNIDIDSQYQIKDLILLWVSVNYDIKSGDLEKGERTVSYYEKHVFVCENNRDPSNPLGCCGSKGGAEITSKLKKLTQEAGLKSKVRVNRAGCLGECASGVAIVIYPAGIWIKNARVSDAETIFNQYILPLKP